LTNCLGFEINPYNECVANKNINDNLKISHQDPAVIKQVFNEIQIKFGKEAPLTISREKFHNQHKMQFYSIYKNPVVLLECARITCIDCRRHIWYCGANAHHKNGVAECAVRSISNMARALLLHASTHWPGGLDSSYWPMAVTYTTYLYNHLPTAQGLCPADIFTGCTVPCHRLKDIHVWGCPVYVLDLHLQEGKKLLKWQPRSRQGVFLGFSTLHSSEVPLVVNHANGSITQQFHVVFNDFFSTVTSVDRENHPPDSWAELCLEHATYIPNEDMAQLDSNLPNIRASLWHQILQDKNYSLLPSLPASPSHPVLDSTNFPPNPDSDPSSPPLSVHAATNPSSAHLPSSDPSPLPPSSPPTMDLTPWQSTRATKGVFSSTRYINEILHSSLQADETLEGHTAQLAYLAGLATCSTSGILGITDPRVYASKVSKPDADLPTYHQAIHGPDASEYIDAMKLEIQTLISQRTWESVPCPLDKPVLKGTWVFKLKRLPDGTPYRYKARFCARGDMQTQGVDFFETYAPVVQWSTI
jgi:hypothetical protein